MNHIETVKPIIKWAGGKTQLLDKLKNLMPDTYGTYFEPFFGGGALYFAVKPQKAVINDCNEQLINLYRIVVSRPEELMNELMMLQAKHAENNDYFYEARKEYNTCLKRRMCSVRSAALFVYLNKAGFNGLYRLNSKGEFNAPSGKKMKINLFDEKNILNASRVLSSAAILSGDFETACSNAVNGDFVFFDSPYYNTFDAYQAGGFSEADHKRLSDVFAQLTKRGVKCMLTNSNEQLIKELYSRYSIIEVDVKRMINCDAGNRQGKEVIITNY